MLTAVVIAKNASSSLPACLASLHFCQHIFVVNNNSTDNTAQVARDLGAKVFDCPIDGDFSALRNFALKKALSEWILFLDSDEVVSEDLSWEIVNALKSTDKNGFYIHREDHIWGRTLKFGDVGTVRILRLGKRSSGVWVGAVHETWQLPHPLGTLKFPIYHYPHPTVVDFLKSINSYSDIRSQELQIQGARSSLFHIILFPLIKFIHLWVIKRGFLDGTQGLIHALIMSFYSFMVRGKLYLLHKGIPNKGHGRV